MSVLYIRLQYDWSPHSLDFCSLECNDMGYDSSQPARETVTDILHMYSSFRVFERMQEL